MLDFIAYVAKDNVVGRACFILKCGSGLAQDVIITIGQVTPMPNQIQSIRYVSGVLYERQLNQILLVYRRLNCDLKNTFKNDHHLRGMYFIVISVRTRILDCPLNISMPLVRTKWVCRTGLNWISKYLPNTPTHTLYCTHAGCLSLMTENITTTYQGNCHPMLRESVMGTMKGKVWVEKGKRFQLWHFRFHLVNTFRVSKICIC